VRISSESFSPVIEEFNEATILDPRNPMTELPNTLSMVREFSAAERAFDRAIALAPDHPILKVLKAYLVTYQKSGSVAAMQAALAELPEPMANDRDVLTWHLFCALNGITTPNGKNRTPSSKFRGAISNGFSACAANGAEEESVSD
jgi:hypothetical protein